MTPEQQEIVRRVEGLFALAEPLGMWLARAKESGFPAGPNR